MHLKLAMIKIKKKKNLCCCLMLTYVELLANYCIEIITSSKFEIKANFKEIRLRV